MKKYAQLTTEDCVKVDNYIYFFAQEINALCKMDIDNGKVGLVSSIPEEDILGTRLGISLVKVGDFLFISPVRAQKIWKYNIKTQEWKSYDKKKMKGSRLEAGMFQMTLFENKIYIVGSNYPAIIVIDLNDDKVTYIENPYERYRKLKNFGSDIFFRTDNVIIGNYMFLASCLDNSITKINLVSFESEHIIVGNSKNKYVGIGYDGTDFYFAPRKGNTVVIWDGNNNYKELSLSDYGLNKDNLSFMGVIYWNDQIILPSFYGKTVVLDTKKQVFIRDEEYYFRKKINNNFLVGLTKKGEIEICQNETIKKYMLEVERKEVDLFIESKGGAKFNNKIVDENGVVGLKEYLRGIAIPDNV